MFMPFWISTLVVIRMSCYLQRCAQLFPSLNNKTEIHFQLCCIFYTFVKIYINETKKSVTPKRNIYETKGDVFISQR